MKVPFGLSALRLRICCDGGGEEEEREELAESSEHTPFPCAPFVPHDHARGIQDTSQKCCPRHTGAPRSAVATRGIPSTLKPMPCTAGFPISPGCMQVSSRGAASMWVCQCYVLLQEGRGEEKREDEMQRKERSSQKIKKNRS